MDTIARPFGADTTDLAYETLAEAVPDLVWSCDPDGRADFVNKRWAEFTGVGRDELEGFDWRSIMHPDDVPAIEVAWGHAMRTRARFESEFRYRRHDGVYFWFWGRAAPVLDEHGEIIRWVGFCADITERRRAQERAAGLQALTAALSEAATPERVADAVVERGIAVLGGNGGLLVRLTADGTLIETVSATGYPKEVASPGLRVPLAGLRMPIPDCLHTGEEVIHQSRASWAPIYPVLAEHPGAAEIDALVALPLFAAGHVIAALGFSFKGPRTFTPDDLAFLRAIAGHAAQALDRARLFEAVERRAAELDAVFYSIADAVLVYGPDGTILKANHTVAEACGLDPVGHDREPLKIKLDVRHLDGRQMELGEAPSSRALRGEVVRDAPLRMRDAAGGERVIRVSGAPIVSAGRPVGGAVVVWHDDTERERLMTELEARRRELAEQNAKLEAVIASMGDGLAIYDGDGELVRLNEAGHRLTGFTPEQIALPSSERRRLLDLRTPEGALIGPELHPRDRALRGEVVRSDLVALDGPPPMPRRWASISASPLRGPDGAIAGAVVTATDVTLLREMQEQQADLLRTISHDLRSPLAAMLMQAQALRSSLASGDKQARRVDAILASGQRLNSMIGDLVEMVRLESGDKLLERRPIDLESYLHELRDRFAGVLDAARLQLDVARGLAPLVADPARLERVLINLLSNALKYSEDEVVVRVDQNVNEVRLEVKDHGPGISPDELPNLFGRFYRSDRLRRADGLGLGLYISALLVRAHGGRIEVESDEGKGSTFRVVLPRASDQELGIEGAPG